MNDVMGWMHEVLGSAGTGDSPIGEIATWESPEDSQVPSVRPKVFLNGWAELLGPHQQSLISKPALRSELYYKKKCRKYVTILNPNQATDVPTCPWHGENTLWEQG